MIMYQAVNPELTSYNHASGLTAAAQIRPIEFQNQRAVPKVSLFDQLMGEHILSLNPSMATKG